MVSPPASRPDSSLDMLTRRFKAYVDSAAFPCVGARSAVHCQRARFQYYGRLDKEEGVARLCDDLAAFSQEFPEPGDQPASFIAMFDEGVSSEAQFERLMWRHLQRLHDHDRKAFAWNAAVSADPASPEFSFSVAGRAFFVVGLSPVASRIARRAPMPCLVFNFHDQFESLRASGKYQGLQQVIRKRDTALQGEINPVLARHGDASEARQYSGRATEPGWRCPFQAGARHG